MVVNMLKELLERFLSNEKEGIKEDIEETKKTAKRITRELIHQVYCVLTPKDKEWDIIRKLQESDRLPPRLNEVYVYTLPRHYERGVAEKEHYDGVVEVRLVRIPFIPPLYRENVFHPICLNPRAGRLHVLLRKGSMEDLYDFLDFHGGHRIHTPPKYL